jgi:hypothetical protein
MEFMFSQAYATLDELNQDTILPGVPSLIQWIHDKGLPLDTL